AGEWILPPAKPSRQREVDLLRNVITSHVAHVIDLGYSARDRITVDSTGIQVFNNFVEVFDQQVDQILTTLDHVLEERFREYHADAAKILAAELAGSGWKEMMRRGGDFFIVDPNGQDRRIMGVVEKGWKSVKAQEGQETCLDPGVTPIRRKGPAG